MDHRETLQIQGVPFYAVEASRPDAQGTLRMRTAVGEANHYVYAVGGTLLNADPETDEQWAASFKSFRFLGTPEIPTEIRPLPTPWKDQSWAFKMGYFFGWLSRNLVLVIAVVTLAASTIGCFFWLNRRPKITRPIGAIPQSIVPPPRNITVQKTDRTS